MGFFRAFFSLLLPDWTTPAGPQSKNLSQQGTSNSKKQRMCKTQQLNKKLIPPRSSKATIKRKSESVKTLAQSVLHGIHEKEKKNQSHPVSIRSATSGGGARELASIAPPPVVADLMETGLLR